MKSFGETHTSSSWARFTPEHKRQTTGNDDAAGTPPHWNNKTSQDNLPGKEEPKQMGDCY
jgi:hypothetical protein